MIGVCNRSFGIYYPTPSSSHPKVAQSECNWNTRTHTRGLRSETAVAALRLSCYQISLNVFDKGIAQRTGTVVWGWVWQLPASWSNYTAAQLRLRTPSPEARSSRFNCRWGTSTANCV